MAFFHSEDERQAFLRRFDTPPPMRKFIITDGEGRPYLTRYVVNEAEDGSKVYLHFIHQSDDDRDFHDHPWDWHSEILQGSYKEYRPESSTIFRPGDVNVKVAEQLHRLEVLEGPVITMVFRGPKRREWGFQTPGKPWVHHETYLNEKFGRGKWSKEYE